MLAKLELELECEETLSYQMGSLFHGVLMELIPSAYAEYLHISQLHPYTQHLEFKEGKWYWIICCLNKEAIQNIIHETLWELKKFCIKKRELNIVVAKKIYKETSYQELMEHFYEQNGTPYMHIHFVSPTAFKKKGKYLFYPELRCVFQSLMNKYDSACTEAGMSDEETLEQLCENAQIIRYDLKSVSFSLEGVKIPAFIGKVTIKMNGTRTMASFAKMLFEFGEYSGIGIKTALGMGCIRFMKERERK